MLHSFDPDSNPYAADLLKLSRVPEARYTDAERRALARIIASKLYQVSLVEPYETDWRYGAWVSESASGRFIDIDVLFDSEFSKLDPWRYRDIRKQLIVLSVGRHGVIELFNGQTRHDVFELVKQAIARIASDGESDERTNERRIPHRNDDKAAADYERGATVESGIDWNSDGAGGQNGGGRGGDGGGDNPDGPPGSGRGGVKEVINHPVLFSAAPEILDAILRKI
ncbi:hypothetical protein [Burkholderia vietnamiensis]|uniref:hypothetical protein n=1 Tax=Burkholderia vietnamiensis TaxID=60552 RepID=UPI001CB2EA1C|nr:hypothetical protein [Burkholderia vietnamiensis]MCA8266072.1 hypothetical protein [Burkholderia vietnamiensis]MDN8035528.1 hypothetical protein [Burkholderia vietnamiensis]UKV73520.1 hypothetical protein FOC29_13790 [Burkholderia vietnamiensis]CAG9234833.1 conserved hypothetical protein [Burkholderia vietnamiensis]HDR8923669.1 hypothetical protein [Burkholderia vietnamiensis]